MKDAPSTGHLPSAAGLGPAEAQALLAEVQVLRLEKQRLQVMLDSSLYVVQAFEAVRDDTGRIVDFTWVFTNKTWQNQYGDPKGQRLLAHNPGVLADGLFKLFVRVTETGVPIDHEHFYDKEQFNGWFHQTLVKMGDGFVMHTEDINARKQAEQHWQASRELLQTTIDSSLNMVQVFEAVRDDTGRIVDFTWVLNNKVSEQYYGDVIGQRLLARNPGVVAAGIFDTFRQVVETGQPDQREQYYPHEQFNGWFYQSVVKLRDGVATTTVDVSARKQAEQEILRLKDAIAQQAEDKYRSLFDSIDEAFALIEMIFDEAGRAVDYRFLETNQVYERQTGTSHIVGKCARELDPNLEAYWLETYGQVALTGEPVRLENYHQRTERWYSAYASRVGGPGSRLVALVFDDVTERKHQEQRQVFLLRLSDGLRPLTKAFELQRAALLAVGEQLGLDQALCIEPASEGGPPVVQVWPEAAGAPLAPFAELWQALPLSQPTTCPNVPADAQLGPATQALCARSGVQAFVVVPLVKNGQVVLTLAALARQPRQWLPHEVALLAETAERTWAAVERARADEALRRSEQQLRVAIDAAELGTWDWDLTTNEVRWNARHYAQLGLAPGTGSLSPFDFARYLHPDDQAEVLRQLHAAVAENRLFKAEFRVLTAQEELRWMSGHGQATDTGPDGRVRRMSGVVLDVTTRKHAEQHLQALAASLERQVRQRTRALRESQELQASVFNTVRNAITVFRAVRDEQGQITDFRLLLSNGVAARYLGPPAPGQTLRALRPGYADADSLRRMAEVVETGQPQDATVQFSADGQPVFLHIQYNKLHDGVVLVHENITERLLAEQEVLKNLRLLEQSEHVAQLGSWVYELATGELRWSAGMYRLFGLVPGTPVAPALYLDYALADDRPVAARVVQTLTTAPADLEETLHLRVGGEVRALRLKAVLVRDEAGHPLRLLGVDLDISRVQRLEADNLRLRLRQQQGLFEAVQAAQEEERRRISESLHNGIGQLLYAIKLQLDRLPNAPAQSPRHEAARLLGEAIQQTRTLSHELTPAILEEFGLEATLQGICQSFNTPTLHWRYYFELEQQLPLPLQLAVYRLTQELAQNVLKHACATEATLEVEVLPAWVVLRVEDNGRGFDPARTSDGLGWRALRSRVALLKGSVHLTTAPGQGTQCQIRLPLAAGL
jgi:signal transduction histidine kinase/GAF domain-containing protein